MLFDFVAALHKCDEQTAQHATVCDLASAARSKRGDYDVVLPWHLLDGSSTSSDASSDVRIAFRTVTVARNISAAPWFQSTFFDDAVDAGAAKADAVLFNVGLWNLRYDSPRSDVPGGYLRELQQLAEALSARSTALDGEAHRPRRLFWRATTPIEPAGNADFPSDYTPDLIRRANEGAWPIMREVAAALGAIDLTERTRVQPLADGASGQTSPGSVAGSGRSGPQLTVDGTHFEPWLNVIMMGDALAGICALEQRLLHAAPAPAGSAGSAAASDAAAFGGGGAGGLAPSFSAAAEGEASPAPSVSPATSAGGDTSSPSQTAGAAAAAVSVKPSSAAVVALTPAPAGVLPIVSVVGGLAAAAIAMYRTRLRTAARSNIGIAITLGFVWLLVSAIERWGLIPIIGKERAVGMDMLWAVFGLAVVVGRLTVTRSAPEQQRNPAAHADSAKSSAAGAAERREQTVVSSSADAAATSIAAAADENSRKPADADAAPSQQAPSAASDVASPSGSVSVAISIASAVEAAADSASGAGALRNREGAADGSVAAAEQEEASLLRDGSAEADSAATARKVESAAKGAMSPSSSAVPAGAGTDGNAAASTEAALVVASGGAGHASSSSPRTGAAAAGVPTFLSLDVCNELKGLCMVCFLLYHYWDVKTVYNPIRVMVAVFLFLTGYGNFLSLSASQKPPKLHKLCLSFIRINLLAAVLMTAVRAPWMLYYICPLHTFWTIVVYVFFWVAPSANIDRKRLGIKLAALTAVLVLLFEIPTLADWLFWPLWPLLQFRGSMFEWVFRARLDAYSSLFGMWLAFGRPEVTAAFTRALKGGWRSLAPFIALVAAVFVGHAVLLYPLGKGDYNGLHRFTTWLPIAAFAVLRCCTVSLSEHYSRVFAAVGSCSLDLYLLQFHLWLAHSSKDILAPVPGARALSFFVNTAAFLAIAWLSAQAQNAVLSTLSTRPRATFAAAAFATAVLIAGTVAWG